ARERREIRIEPDMLKWRVSSNSRIIRLFPTCAEGADIYVCVTETSRKCASRIRSRAIDAFLFGLLFFLLVSAPSGAQETQPTPAPTATPQLEPTPQPTTKPQLEAPPTATPSGAQQAQPTTQPQPAPQPTAAPSGTQTIEKIDVIGNRRIPTDTVRS